MKYSMKYGESESSAAKRLRQLKIMAAAENIEMKLWRNEKPRKYLAIMAIS